MSFGERWMRRVSLEAGESLLKECSGWNEGSRLTKDRPGWGVHYREMEAYSSKLCPFQKAKFCLME